MRMKINVLICFVVVAATSILVVGRSSIADTTTQPSVASMGTYKGMLDSSSATLELKENQVALLSYMMPDSSDKTKMMECKSEGKWTIEDKTVTIVMTTMNGQAVPDDDARKKLKLLVDEHGDKLVGDDKVPAELKRQP